MCFDEECVLLSALCFGVATFVFCWVHCVLFLGIMLSRVPMEHLCFVECIVCFGSIYQYYVFFCQSQDNFW